LGLGDEGLPVVFQHKLGVDGGIGGRGVVVVVGLRGVQDS